MFLPFLGPGRRGSCRKEDTKPRRQLPGVRALAQSVLELVAMGTVLPVIAEVLWNWIEIIAVFQF